MAKNLMIQGTMSNAGKSILTAGILRVLKQDGYRVAPFKSQNMALNSYITREGLEMGRAQVMQAEAAGIEPNVWMNPILLKPNSDMGSQVIVNGEVFGNREARDYFRMKKSLIPSIMKAYGELDSRYDIIVIEGAGSPAEINLKENDIVNMGLAALVDAPVLLVGDIDRGGVFAQLLGTIWLLEEEERARVKGLVINKFRGDKSILDPGLKQLYDKCGIPVTGVIPYVRLDIDEEDSLSEKLEQRTAAGGIDAAVIRVPHISNFTDFGMLEGCEGVSVRYVKSAGELGKPDLLLIPGSKNTMADLLWMRENGLEAGIQRLAGEGCRIMGICGGYQMLGGLLEDPEGVEHGGSLAGMGLLPVVTRFRGKKHRTRVEGNVGKLSGVFEQMSGTRAEGYEIHMGESTAGEGCSCFADVTDCVTGQQYADGCVKGNVCGTYIHGILDSPELLKGLLEPLYREKGIQPGVYRDLQAYKQEQYDRLADVIRMHLDMEAVYRIIGLD